MPGKEEKIAIRIIVCAAVLSVFIAASPIFLPFFANAEEPPTAPSQLVPMCNYPGWPPGACTICDIFKLAQNILNYLYYGLALPLATLMILYGGFLMVFSGMEFGKAGAYEKGKKVLKNAAIGLLVIFLAWLMIDTIIKVLANQDLTSQKPGQLPIGYEFEEFSQKVVYGPWNKIECKPIISSVPDTHTECQNNACVTVQSKGDDKCELNKPCGQAALKAWKCATTPPACSCAETSPGANCQQISTVTCTAPGPVACPQDTEEQALAKILLGPPPLCGGSKSCGNVGACDTLQAVANGQLPAVCFSGCTSSSACPPKNVHLSVAMLKALDATNLEGKKFIIISLTTGSHSANSLHYQGRAVDVQATGGTSYTMLESSFMSKGAFYAQCEDKDSVKIPCNSSQGIVHIHAQFP